MHRFSIRLGLLAVSIVTTVSLHNLKIARSATFLEAIALSLPSS